MFLTGFKEEQGFCKNKVTLFLEVKRRVCEVWLGRVSKQDYPEGGQGRGDCKGHGW